MFTEKTYSFFLIICYTTTGIEKRIPVAFTGSPSWIDSIDESQEPPALEPPLVRDEVVILVGPDKGQTGRVLWVARVDGKPKWLGGWIQVEWEAWGGQKDDGSWDLVAISGFWTYGSLRHVHCAALRCNASEYRQSKFPTLNDV